jgi:polyferredoxin
LLARRRLAQVAFLVFLFVQALFWYLGGVRLAGKLSPLVFLYTLRSGVITAATLFWLVVLVSAVVVGPRYCGWVCAWGSFQDFLAPWAARLRPSVARPARLLRALRYGLLVGILYLSTSWLLQEPPSRLALKIAAPPPLEGLAGLFPLTVVALTVILVRALGTRAWCRYICPVGAAIGLLGLFSTHKIRSLAACVDCGRCARACPKGVDVAAHISRRGWVTSPDCNGCLECVESCPQMALAYGPAKEKVPGARPGPFTGV